MRYIWHVSRPNMDGSAYSQFVQFIAVAATEDEARRMHPESTWKIPGVSAPEWNGEKEEWTDQSIVTWPVRPDELTVVCLGTANDGVEPGIIVADYYGE